MRGALGFAAVLGLCPFSLGAHADVAGILATSSQKVHPVLIRNERNPVVQVVVESSTSAAVEVAAVTFSLAGSTHLAGIDSLTLFACGDAAEFVPTLVFDEVIAPATTVVFHGRAPLQAGRNVFWLSVKLKPSAELSGRFAAACMEIKTSLGVVTPQDMTPGRDHRVGIALRKAREDGVHTCRIPALATSAAGTLLCASMTCAVAPHATCRRISTLDSAAASTVDKRGNRRVSSWTWVRTTVFRRNRMAAVIPAWLSTTRLARSSALRSGCAASLESTNGPTMDRSRDTTSASQHNSCWSVPRMTAAPGARRRTSHVA